MSGRGATNRAKPAGLVCRSVAHGRLRDRATVLGALALALVLGAGSAPAAEDADAEGSRWGYALAHELMSPYCPGRTLSACPSEQAAELRQWILLQEAAGATREEVIAVLEERFGEEIRSAPEARGWGLAAWALPGAALAVGALLVVLVLRRMVRAGGDGTASARTPAVPARPRPVAAAGEADDPDRELERLVDAELAASDR